MKSFGEEKGFDSDGLLEKFYNCYCAENLDLPKESLLKLQEDGILCLKVIRNFLVVKDYMEALQKHNNFSMKAAEEIAQKYGMTSRQIQNIIYKWEGRFRKMG